jgi:hypothetical protein
MLTSVMLLVACVLVVAAAWLAMSRRRHLVRWRANVRCPNSRRLAHLTVIEDLDTHRAVEVARCSELRNPDRIDCNKKCLAGMNLVRDRHLLTDHPMRDAA